MATSRWAHFVSWARTARSWRLPITVLLGFREDTGRFLEQDKIMALALQQYEESIHSCGVPASKAFGDHNVGTVEWHEEICHACAGRESAAENDKNPMPGKIRYPVWED